LFGSRGDLPTDLELVKLKACMVGEAAVGKTSLVRRFVLDLFNEAYAATLGARVTKREMHFKGLEVQKHVRVDMTLWDIMGERFVRDELRESYLLGAQAVVAVADIARPSTHDAIEAWLEWVRNAVGDVPVVYAINKYDLLPELMRRPDDAEIGAQLGMKDVAWFYTSAKTGLGVDDVFTSVAKQVLAEVLDYQVEPLPRGMRPSPGALDLAGAMGP
jgi:small GTP-binding protein